MRSFVFFSIFLISFSLVAQTSTDAHKDHGHKAGEKCEQDAVTSSKASDLGKAVTAVEKSIKFTPEFCQALKDCDESYAYSKYCEAGGPKLTARCGLVQQEAAALDSYMGSGYSCVNPVLYGKSKKNVGAFVTSINQALGKFPQYEGFVARGAALPKAILNQHTVGSTVTYKAFTSTSTNASIALGFSEDESGSVVFLIYSKTGRPIMGFSSGEYEVLFKSNTKFKVLKNRAGKSDYSAARFIVMREVPANEGPSAGKKMDQFVLNSLKKLPAKKPKNSEEEYDFGHESDSWECPENGLMPKNTVKQTLMPNFGELAKYFRE